MTLLHLRFLWCFRSFFNLIFSYCLSSFYEVMVVLITNILILLFEYYNLNIAVYNIAFYFFWKIWFPLGIPSPFNLVWLICSGNIEGGEERDRRSKNFRASFGVRCDPCHSIIIIWHLTFAIIPILVIRKLNHKEVK